MTVAVMVKVFDGVVIAADSATTFGLQDAAGNAAGHQVYNGANKVFHLHRKLPIGAATWGVADLGGASIGALAKDLRTRFMGEDPDHLDWKINEDAYTMEEVAKRVLDFYFDELYGPLLAPGPGVPAGPAGELGLLLAGYGAGSKDNEVWSLRLTDPTDRPDPDMVAGGDQSGWMAFAQSSAMNRLLRGYDDDLEAALHAKFVSAEVQDILDQQPFVTVPSSMPFLDAIALARFMVDVSVGYSRYQLGPDSIGGPVEVAGISRHEGFKWVSRKHYFTSDLNPQVT